MTMWDCAIKYIADSQISLIMRNPWNSYENQYIGTSFRILNIVHMDNGYILHTTSLQKITV